MKRSEYMSIVLSEIYDKYQKPLLAREISNHIDDRLEYYLNAGFSYDEAEEKALLHMGNPKELGVKMNLLHNNTRLDIVSIVSLYFLGAQVLFTIAILVFLFFFSLLPFSLGDVVDNTLAFVTKASVGNSLIWMALIYLVCAKTKNYKHLIVAGALGLFNTTKDLLVTLFLDTTTYYDEDLGTITELFSILSDGKIIEIVQCFLVITLLFEIVTAILMLGFGLYLKSYIYGETKTDIISGYERYRFLPVFVVIAKFVFANVFYVLMMKGFFMYGGF